MLFRAKWFVVLLVIITAISSCDSYHKIDNFKYNQNIILDGVVSSIHDKKDNKLEFTFHTHKYGNILLKADEQYSHYITPANKLELEAKIYKPYEYSNTKSFNYAKYLERKHIVALGKVVDNSKMLYKGTSIRFLPEKIRFDLYSYLETSLQNYKTKSLMLALLVGKKSFDDEDKKLFMESGTSHLMVISGLHIGLLGLVAFFVARIIWSFFPSLCRKLPAQYIAVIFSIIAALMYSLLAGFSIPTQRAVIMVAVVGVLWLFRRRAPIAKSLCLALIIILILDFSAIYSASLWLSFSAVMFLVFVSIILQQYKSKLISSLLGQVYLAILLIPASVFYFNAFSIVSILANLVAIPLASMIIVPSLLLSLVLSFIGINLWIIPDFFLKVLKSYLSILVKHIGLIEYWSYFSFINLLLVIIGLVIVFLPVRKSFRLLGLSLCLVFFQSTENISKEYNSFGVHIFDTKQLMVLVENKGKSLLYTSSKNISDDFVLENYLKKYLQTRGITHVDYLVISDYKDYLNTKKITNVIPVDKIIANGKNTKAEKCNFENSFSLFDAKVKLLGYGNNCSIDFKVKDNDLLFIDAPIKSQEKIYSLYNRTIQPNIVISSTIPYYKIIHKYNSKFFVYTSNKNISKKDYATFRKNKVKVIDTYNNGAISLEIDKNSKLSITSELKKY